MSFTLRWLALTALILAFSLSTLYVGITVWRDPEASNRGVLGWWTRFQTKLFGPSVKELNRLFAKPTAIVMIVVGLVLMAVALYTLFNPF